MVFKVILNKSSGARKRINIQNSPFKKVLAPQEAFGDCNTVETMSDIDLSLECQTFHLPGDLGF